MAARQSSPGANGRANEPACACLRRGMSWVCGLTAHSTRKRAPLERGAAPDTGLAVLLAPALALSPRKPRRPARKVSFRVLEPLEIGIHFNGNEQRIIEGEAHGLGP